MELECARVSRFILPAVRASVAAELNERDYNQQEIAAALGVAQVAVSKYLNGKYSKQVGEIKRYIMENKLDREILRHVGRSDSHKINSAINNLCADIATKNVI